MEFALPRKGCDVALISGFNSHSVCYHSPDSYVDTHVKGTLNIIQAAKDLGVERVLITSLPAQRFMEQPYRTHW